MPEWVESIDSRFIIGARSVIYVNENFMDGIVLTLAYNMSSVDYTWADPYGEVFSSRRVGSDTD